MWTTLYLYIDVRELIAQFFVSVSLKLKKTVWEFKRDSLNKFLLNQQYISTFLQIIPQHKILIQPPNTDDNPPSLLTQGRANTVYVFWYKYSRPLLSDTTWILLVFELCIEIPRLTSSKQIIIHGLNPVLTFLPHDSFSNN